MELTRHASNSAELPAILTLIRDSFAYMDGIIDPPSSMHRLTLDKLRETANTAELWSIGPPLLACVVLTPQPNALYVGKLSVAATARGRKLASRLIDHAEARAKVLELPSLTLQVRVELSANHAIFAKLGFTETGRTAHAGYANPTSITFEKRL